MVTQAELQTAKNAVRAMHAALDAALASSAPAGQMAQALAPHVSSDYFWRGVHPFHEQRGVKAAVDAFWWPLRAAFAPIQRRTDVFFAGANDVDGGATCWVASMGHLLGLFDAPWLGIRPTGRMVFLRQAEFNRVTPDGKIAETALFCDIIGVMQQAGQYPLPPMTGAAIVAPGPRTHDGLQYAACAEGEGTTTMALVNRMVADLNMLNKSGLDDPPPELLARTWRDDMIWYGPTGIGASYTIPRYQQQHQYPFRKNLKDKVFNGHVARFAEGNYAGFFGWPNLNNRNNGGFLGMPASDVHAPMRVVDIYRREGDKLAENWVFIDLLHYLNAQGLDVLARDFGWRQATP
jgi:hypothetical protein